MTDAQIEKLVIKEIEKRGITFYDMIGLSNANIDTDPEDKTTPVNQRARRNRFNGITESDRIGELLCVGEYNPYKFSQPLKVPFQDLFRFWWHRCVIQELVVEEVLEDIFAYFIEQMRPPEKKKEGMDMTIDFEQLPFSSQDKKQAA